MVVLVLVLRLRSYVVVAKRAVLMKLMPRPDSFAKCVSSVPSSQMVAASAAKSAKFGVNDRSGIRSNVSAFGMVDSDGLCRPSVLG